MAAKVSHRYHRSLFKSPFRSRSKSSKRSMSMSRAKSKHVPRAKSSSQIGKRRKSSSGRYPNADPSLLFAPLLDSQRGTTTAMNVSQGLFKVLNRLVHRVSVDLIKKSLKFAKTTKTVYISLKFLELAIIDFFPEGLNKFARKFLHQSTDEVKYFAESTPFVDFIHKGKSNKLVFSPEYVEGLAKCAAYLITELIEIVEKVNHESGAYYNTLVNAGIIHQVFEQDEELKALFSKYL